MKPSWLNSVLPIAALFSFRMLGLFMLIPVFTLYAVHLENATPTLMGIALGSYGLSQGLLQIPFGMLSDRFGRKPILVCGLLLFVAGSLLGAWTDSIYGMIMARTMQGAGAIGSVLIALLADLTSDEERTKAMAIIGITIGMSFALAMVISPILVENLGLSAIFYFTAILALLGLFLLYFVIPTPKRGPFYQNQTINFQLFKRVLSNPHLQRLNIGIFCQHLMLTATFYAVPLLLEQHAASTATSQAWHFYLPLLVLSFICMVPCIILAEKKGRIKLVFSLSILTTALCQCWLGFISHHWLSLCICLFGYFISFNILEASLPSLISRQAHIESKGTAMGVYSSSQFLGIFVGGVLAGILHQYFPISGLFIVNGLIAFAWFFMALFMNPTAYQTTLRIPYTSLEQDEEQLRHRLASIPGITQVVLSTEEQMIYVRINKALYQQGSAEETLQIVKAFY